MGLSGSKPSAASSVDVDSDRPDDDIMISLLCKKMEEQKKEGLMISRNRGMKDAATFLYASRVTFNVVCENRKFSVSIIDLKTFARQEMQFEPECKIADVVDFMLKKIDEYRDKIQNGL